VSTQQVPQRAARLHQLWSRLPDSPLTEDELEAAILKVLDRPGAEADASAYKSMLLHAQAVVTTRDEDSVIRCRRSESFPTWDEEVGPGSAAWDWQLDELAEEEKRQHDATAEEALKNSPQSRQRIELDQHIRQVLREDEGARAVLIALVGAEVRRVLPGLIREQIRSAELRGQMRERIGQTDATAQAAGDTERPA
jgi:hypothetical protein